MRALWSVRAGRLLIVAAGLLTAGTIAGLVVLWPSGDAAPPARDSSHTEAAKVVAAMSTACQAGECRSLEIELLSGPDRGRVSIVNISPRDTRSSYGVDDRVRVLASGSQAGVGDVSEEPQELPGALPGAKPLARSTYSIVDHDRRGPILWLALAFAVLVIAAGRVRGILALAGVGTSVLLVTQFVVPAMFAQESAFLVALVGSLAATIITIGLTSGLSAQSLAATLGIGVSLLLASTLGLIYVDVAHLNGSGSELAFVLGQTSPELSLQGLVLAGFVIGALGVLADMAVTQASAVMALRRANPDLSRGQLYREAYSVGRDHLSATVHTLVFAYVGASLPLLLLFKTAGVSFTDAFNGQDVAEAVVATLVGSIGVVASVPITTGLAALLAHELPPSAVGAGAHAHHHH